MVQYFLVIQPILHTPKESVSKDVKYIIENIKKILENAKKEDIKDFIEKNWMLFGYYYGLLSAYYLKEFGEELLEYPLETLIENLRRKIYEVVKNEKYYDLIEALLKLNYWGLRIVKEFGFFTYSKEIVKILDLESLKNIIVGYMLILLLMEHNIEVDRDIIENVSFKIERFVEDLIDVFYQVREEYIRWLK